MLKGLKENGIEVLQIHRSIWSGIEDKSQIKNLSQKVKLLLLWLLSYPILLFKYCNTPKHSAVVIGYLGHLDVLILWPFAKIRGVPIVWDAFISLYDTIVADRNIISASNPVAWCIFFLEWLACKAADHVILDTSTHAKYFRTRYNLSEKKCIAVFVGAEQENFPQKQKIEKKEKKELTILFYGQCIPLHGIEVILEAAQILKEKEHIHWRLIGTGQDENKIAAYLSKRNHLNLEWIKWVDYPELSSYIHEADICLGIFGTSDKASRVIPNKVFQIISCGKTFITRTSPAMAELFGGKEDGAYFVEAGSGKELAQKILHLDKNRNSLNNEPHFSNLRNRISPKGVTVRLKNLLHSLQQD